MRISMRTVHFSADDKLKELIERKLQKLSQFYDRIQEVQVFLKLENSSRIKDKMAELIVEVPGHRLVVKERDKTFEKAIDRAQSRLKRLVKRHKDRIRSF